MKHVESSLSVIAEASEVLGGVIAAVGVIKGFIIWRRPVKVSGDITDKVLIKVKVRRRDNVLITDAGVYVSRRQFGRQGKRRFFGIAFGRVRIPLIANIKVSKEEGAKVVAWQPTQRVQGLAADQKARLASPIRPYARYDGSRRVVGRPIRLSVSVQTALGMRSSVDAN